jgi:hypothetical protein
MFPQSFQVGAAASVVSTPLGDGDYDDVSKRLLFLEILLGNLAFLIFFYFSVFSCILKIGYLFDFSNMISCWCNITDLKAGVVLVQSFSLPYTKQVISWLSTFPTVLHFPIWQEVKNQYAPLLLDRGTWFEFGHLIWMSLAPLKS